MDYLFYILFFVAVFVVNIVKNVMEERERVRTHEAAKRFGSSAPRPSSARRKIGGYEVFGGEGQEKVFVEVPKKEEEIPQREINEAFAREIGEDLAREFDEEIGEDLPQNSPGFYEERLAEAQRLIEEQNAAAKRISDGIFARPPEGEALARGFAAELLKRRADLADAIILSEIIQPPLSMRRG